VFILKTEYLNPLESNVKHNFDLEY